MSFTNSYKPPVKEDFSRYYGPDPYDLNFVFPIDLSALQSDRVCLTPFIPSIHAQHYTDQMRQHPELQRWLPYDHSKLENVLEFFEVTVRRSPNWVLFAIIDKDRPDPAHPEFGGGSMAGIIGLIFTSEPNLSTEIGWVVVFPAFQRTYVTSNAVGTLLRFCLEVPTAPMPGLGLRRVQWTTNIRNLTSARTAEKMGFKREGTIRWTYTLAEGKEGDAPREGDPKPNSARRDSAMLSMCCDDWENGARESVERIINRVS